MQNARGSWEAAKSSIHELADNFIDLFAIEGRIATLSALRIIVFAVTAGIFVALASLFVALAIAVLLVKEHDWQWQHVLFLMAGVHAVAAVAIIVMVRKIARTGFFPSTLAQLRAAPAAESNVHVDIAELMAELRTRESALVHSKQEATERLIAAKEAAMHSLAKPAVLLAVAGIGFVLARLARKSGTAPSTRSARQNRLEWFARLATGPLVTLVVPAVMRSIEARNRKRR